MFFTGLTLGALLVVFIVGLVLPRLRPWRVEVRHTYFIVDLLLFRLSHRRTESRRRDFLFREAKCLMWRPGGHHYKEWWWYNGEASGAYEVEKGGSWRQILQIN